MKACQDGKPGTFTHHCRYPTAGCTVAAPSLLPAVVAVGSTVVGGIFFVGGAVFVAGLLAVVLARSSVRSSPLAGEPAVLPGWLSSYWSL